MIPIDALRSRVNDLAADLGRIGRTLDRESSAFFAWDRCCNHVETIANMLSPSAAELVGCHAPGDPVAVEEAIRLVDARAERLRARLGKAAA